MAGAQDGMGNRVSTVLARKVGGQLLAYREAAGMTQTSAAQALTATAAKVAKMERGWVPFRDPDIIALCKAYGVDAPSAVDNLLRLAKADRDRRKAKGWWNQYPEVRATVEYVALEDIATSIRSWQLAFIPGLLQTPDYARALAVGSSWEKLEDIEPFVETRIARQARLGGERPLQLWVVLYEGALRQLVGGQAVMRNQLGHLLDMAARPNVRFQVLPHLAGAHPGMTGAFTIVSFAELGAIDVVHMDTASSTLWLESESDATRHAGVFDRITRLGLAQHNSIKLVESIRKEL